MCNQKFLKMGLVQWLFVVFLTSMVNGYAEMTINPVANEHGTTTTSGGSGKTQENPEISHGGSTEQEPERHPNYVIYSTEPTVEKVKINVPNKAPPELKVADIIAIILGLVGLITIVAALLPIFLFFFEKSVRSELKESREEIRKDYEERLSVPKDLQQRLDDQIESYMREVERSIDRQSGRHEERLYHAELVLGQLWGERDKKIQMASAEMTKIFLEEFPKHLKDNLVLRQLLLPDQKAIHEALGTLEKYDYLPRETVAFVRLLYKQGRLKDAGVLSAARRILERFDERLTEEEGKST